MTLEEQRLRGKTDHMYLATHVLEGTGVSDFQENPHRGLFSYFLQKNPAKNLTDLDIEIKKRMIMWPRGLFKTSAVVIDIIQFILCYPNVRIGFLSGSIQVAKDQLQRVKEAFEDPTERFKELYPEYCGPKLGNQSRFTVPNRTLKMTAQPTMMVTSAKSVKAGLHFDLLFVDDLVNDQNYQNAVALEACWQDYLAVGPLVDPAGYTFITGTPYAFGDCYERIEESAQKEMKELKRTVWSFSIRTCWKSIEGKKEVLFPQTKTKDGKTIGHTVQFLESERIQRGEEFFALQYECTRMSKLMQTFTDDLLNSRTIHHLRDIPAEQVSWCFAIGDLSYVGDERNGAKRDKSVIYIVRVFQGKLFVIACITGKWKSAEVGMAILQIILHWKPRVFFIEAFLGWEAYDTVFKMLATQYKMNLVPIEWLPLNNQDEAKKVRIGSIHAWLVQGKLWIFAGIEEFETLKEQLKKWPKFGRHDDFADCLGLGCNAPHGVALERIPQVVQPNQSSTLNKIHFPLGLPYGVGAKEQEQGYENRGAGSGIVC